MNEVKKKKKKRVRLHQSGCPMRDVHYFTEFLLPNLMSTVFEEYHSCVFVSLIKFTYFDSSLVSFNFDIFSLIRKDIYHLFNCFILIFS